MEKKYGFEKFATLLQNVCFLYGIIAYKKKIGYFDTKCVFCVIYSFTT